MLIQRCWTCRFILVVFRSRIILFLNFWIFHLIPLFSPPCGNAFPLPKVKTPSFPSNYRPISLLCFFPKVLERMVYNQFVPPIPFLSTHSSPVRHNIQLDPVLVDLSKSSKRQMTAVFYYLFKFKTHIVQTIDDVQWTSLKTFCEKHCWYKSAVLSYFNLRRLILITNFPYT